MTRDFRFSACLLAMAWSLPGIGPAGAQVMVAPQVPGDADELAVQMRQLAADPQNLAALIRAGELALRLDDNSAAAGFFARAERIDPRNARIKAGMGSLLVGEERPGEALRRFSEAEALGVDPRAFAADRGLAYDLIGEQDRAQREYRAALRAGTSDETIRRYALSLGISGKRDEAFAVLEPLLRRSDRGSWRSRAFILAMNGDQTGASQIATSMLPPGMAQGLQPFFERLPYLPAVDRAFAVHFGEIRPTPERIADARNIPPLPVLGPDPFAPRVAVAQAVAPVAAVSHDDRRNARRRRGAVVAAAAPAPVPVPPPLPAPPAYVASFALDDEPLAPAASTLPSRSVSGTAMVQPLPTGSGSPVRAPSRPPVSFTAAGAASLPKAVVPPAVVPALPPPPPSPVAVQANIAPLPPLAVAETGRRIPGSAGSAEPPIVPSQDSASDEEDAPATTTTIAAETPAREVPPPVAAPVESAVKPQPAIVSPAPPPAVVAGGSPAKAGAVRSEDSILASIIAGITVPGSELAGPPPVRRPPAVAAPVEKPAPVAVTTTKPGTKPADTAKAAEAARKAAAAARKAADEKKRNDPKLLEPERIWVQVAGGANEAALAMAWNTMKGRAPAAFKGRQGWTTPLRATNRVLAGPFKTDDDARAFVNTLAKSGVQAFTFTSEAGQKITRLPTK